MTRKIETQKREAIGRRKKRCMVEGRRENACMGILSIGGSRIYSMKGHLRLMKNLRKPITERNGYESLLLGDRKLLTTRNGLSSPSHLVVLFCPPGNYTKRFFLSLM
jgi:hypothetical protein